MPAQLIPRSVLFGNPDRAMVQISPDGRHIGWLAPVDGVLNVWVAPRDDIGAARAITRDTGRGIRFFGWAYTNEHLLFIQDKDGDENWRIYRADLAGGAPVDLTPIDGIQARVQQASPDFPEEILVAINNRAPQYHDIHRLDILTGKMQLVLQHDRFVQVLTDHRFEVREGYEMTPDGGVSVYRRDGDEWTQTEHIPAEDSMTTDTIGYDRSGATLYMTDSRGRDTSALFAVDVATGTRTLLAEDERSDVAGLIRHPRDLRIQAAAFDYERKRWQILDPSIAEHFTRLAEVARGDVEVASRSLDDRFWIVAYTTDNGPVPYYLYDSRAGDATLLFTDRAALEGLPLVQMHAATIATRDGLDMVVYWSLPPGTDADGDGIPDTPVPLVLHPHGGPWARDHWGFDATHQWLANRGYAVMSVNFRSSTGFGKRFTNAGNNEWGGKILEDQIDAVEWAVANGIADRSRVGITGGSFGGYSTLAGLAFYPDVYACGVDIVGPSNLITLLESVPEYWKPMLDMLKTRVGDNGTESGRELLERHSPLTRVDSIRRPLLIGQGANDPRVKQAESDQIVSAMQSKGIPVVYVLYPDEGHGFARPENRLSFYAIAEAFFAEYLGGRAEPIGSDFSSSSLQVPAGADQVPGLVQALAKAAG